jgi:hypothetical protein
VALLDRDFAIAKANTAFAQLFKSRPAEIAGSAIDQVGGAAWRLEAWRENAGRFIAGKALPALTIGQGEGAIVLNARAVPAPDSPDTTLLMVSVSNGVAK